MRQHEMVIQQFTVQDASQRRYQMVIIQSWDASPAACAGARTGSTSQRFALTTGETAIRRNHHTFEVILPGHAQRLTVHRLK
ncbi:hypothetical protein [Pseudoduganella violacea]|uniref:Uncharacterized protein n=1 Tax=Pseudoduganella violacea TaxID=1715466 RepID=A0A7W5BFG8_9BURK|nr:hypothetical protein [Pseudoduganella violacea]MBB3122199.1 hypothetical protein [Pseudoduganella violacea]